MEILSPAFVPLAAWPQFVTWRLVPSVRQGKMDKLPCDWRNGRVTSAHDPATWGTFEECRDAMREGRGQGVGFVFTANDPFWFLDIDNAWNGTEWSPLAVDLCQRFAGAAVEVSQSGTGLHIIGSGEIPEHGCRNIPLGLELYHELRFVALTGTNATGSAATDHAPAMAAAVAQLFPFGAKAAAGPDEWTNEPVPEWAGPATDDDLIRRALGSGDRSAAAAFGGDAVTFRDLWENNADVLAKRWPSDTHDEYNRSSADAALAAHLAFWTGKNCERIRDLMYRSALVRDKWEARGDYYLPRTILRACEVSADVAKGASAPPAEPVRSDPHCYPGSLSLGGQPTEESLAREFVAINGGEWRFDHTAGKWHHWDGQRWARDSCRLIEYLISEHLRATVVTGFQLRIASICSSKTMRGVETLAKAHPAVAITSALWDANPLLLGTPDGTVDLSTGEIRAANPEEHITKLAAVAPREGEPALWLRFLHEALAGDMEAVRFLQRLCGYCLTGSTREHALAFIHGPGGNGKSVFLNTVASILGDYAVTAAMGTFADSRGDRHSTELAMLAGARLVTASETEQGRGWDEAKLKAITGGDPITARFMRQDNFTFWPQFKLLVAGNYAPSLRDVGPAMRRRFFILPFTVMPASPDPNLEVKLRPEWPQIMAWMIAGCQEWQSGGLRRPNSIADATERYFADQDTFGQWLEECCEVAAHHTALPTPLFQAWSNFARCAGEATGTLKDFKATLQRRDIVSVKSNGVRFYRGVRISEGQKGS